MLTCLLFRPRSVRQTRRTQPLVGKDTYLIIILCFYTNLEAHDLFTYSQTKSTTKPNRVWNVKSMKRQLGAAVCENILFIHAVLGCDMTSRLYSLGKLKKFTTSTLFQAQSPQFLTEDESPDVVETAREKVLVSLYKSKPDERLDSLRYNCKGFCEEVAVKSSKVRPQTLPPTSAAARYHSWRVYLQVQQWRSNNGPQALDWGWRMSDGNLVPIIMTDLPPAPQDLLNVIQYNCSTDCSSARCTCCNNNLECSRACGQCRGSGCSNFVLDSISDDNDEETDD